MMEKLWQFLKKTTLNAEPIFLDLCREKRCVLFYRTFYGFTGGHLKVWHYYNHVKHSKKYEPLISFSPDTIWEDANPWLALRHQVLSPWDVERADVLFLAGMDWSILTETQRNSPPKPIINLIQHVRHAVPQESLYRYLSHRAVRICVSEQVTEALRTTKKVNGPLFTIPNGIDFTELPLCKSWESRDFDILVVGIKQPLLATEIRHCLDTSNYKVEIITDLIPRSSFLNLLSNSKITLFLPNMTEGFYLPALEGFALGTLVICPDCIGNRTFCLPNKNCLQPYYNAESILGAIQDALQLTSQKRNNLLQAGWQIAQQHSLLNERRSFLEILDHIKKIW